MTSALMIRKFIFLNHSQLAHIEKNYNLNAV